MLALGLHYRRWLVGVPVTAAFATAAIVLLLPVKYTTSVRFVPEQSSTSTLLSEAGVLGNIAASLRLSPAQALTNSPQYYNQLLVSRPILERAAWTAYPVPDQGITHQLSVIDYLELQDLDSAQATYHALEALRTNIISQGVSFETGVATLSVTTKDRTLSYLLAAHLMELVNEYNLDVRQTSAHAQRVFLDTRLEEAEAQLKDSENALQSFRTTNREIQSSPALQLEAARLQRRLEIQQQLYISLKQQYETARLQEVRDTPLLSIIDPPALALRRDRRHGLAKMVISAAAALGLVLTAILLSEAWRGRGSRANLTDLESELSALQQDLRYFIRRRRKMPSGSK
jgi:uncharacterized protein involved in exopolysaccharide biosynthesis